MLPYDDDTLSNAARLASLPAPLAPYWDGTSFEEALDVSVSCLRSEGERVRVYEQLCGLLERDDEEVRYHALQRLGDAFRAELWEELPDRPPDGSAPADRLAAILSWAEQHLSARPELLEEICSCFAHFDDSVSAQIRDWLDRLDSRRDEHRIPANTLLAARIRYGALGATWTEAGGPLTAAIDHDDLTVRACAAYQIGRFCRRLSPNEEEYDCPAYDPVRDRIITAGMASLEHYWEWIRKKEIERPGVAGAFWNGAPTWTIDAEEWMLGILTQTGPEPEVGYFPCNLAFFAHELFSRNPRAVSRLISAGRIGLALAAATEEHWRVRGMAPLLAVLANHSDPEIARQASWTLAYNYGRLHPNGERLGFVKRHSGIRGCDVLILFTGGEERESPYAIILWPKTRPRYWTLERAQQLADQVFPPSIRGEAQEDPYSSPKNPWYQRGYIQYTMGTCASGAMVQRIIIGYRSSVAWHPFEAV